MSEPGLKVRRKPLRKLRQVVHGPHLPPPGSMNPHRAEGSAVTFRSRTGRHRAGSDDIVPRSGARVAAYVRGRLRMTTHDRTSRHVTWFRHYRAMFAPSP